VFKYQKTDLTLQFQQKKELGAESIKHRKRNKSLILY